MSLFDPLTGPRDALTALDQLLPDTAPAAGPDSLSFNDGFDTASPDWASLDVGFSNNSLGDVLFGEMQTGDSESSDDIAGTSTGFPDTTPGAGSPALGGDADAYGLLAFFRPQDGTTGLHGDSGLVETGFDGSIADAAQGAPDVMVIDGGDFAKGGKPGGGGGGGGGGGSGSGVLSSYTSGAAGAYNIDISFKGSDWTVDLQKAFIDSADLLSNIITDDIPDVFFRGKVIDDIKIDAELTAIDGVGGVLGQAGPTAIRTSGYLPATAVMQFDTADATDLNNNGVWDEVVLHEMLHSIGFGSIWSYLGLVNDTDPNAPTFNGTHAQAAAGGTVMVEGDGGSGTALSHWDEAAYGTEIMTGYLYTNTGTVTNPVWVPSNVDKDLAAGTPSLTDTAADSDLSNMTIASLEDLGYHTIWPDNNII